MQATRPPGWLTGAVTLCYDRLVPLFVSVSMIPVGLVLTGWGLWASGRPSRVVALVGAVAAPAGVALALCGTLLVCVPDFFAG